MDVTSQVINEVEFHQKMRGYDPDEVDDFLERVAVAFEQLQERVRGAEQRSAIAEQRAAESMRLRGATASAPAAQAAPAADEAEETETIRRTLVLAQRTADAAVKEARDEARRILDAAHEQTHRVQTEAQEQARKLVVDAEAEARKSADETRQRLIREIISLEETRDTLRADHGILERHLDEQRLRLRSSIGDLQRLLDDPGRLRASNTPELSGVTRPEFVDEEIAAAEAEPEAIDDVEEAEVIDLDAATDATADDAEPRPRSGGITFTPPEEHNGSSGPVAPRSVALATDPDDDEAWAAFASGDVDQPTMPVSVVQPSDDAYLTELRKAMLEDTSAATLDPGEHRARTRFGRRR